jgi:glyoxylate utilization-related uncharacterized protein
MKVEKKAWPEYFQAIIDGKKHFDLRLDEFEIGEGDTLWLREFNPATQKYTGRELEKKVSYVVKVKLDKLFWSQEEIMEKGLVVISLE